MLPWTSRVVTDLQHLITKYKNTWKTQRQMYNDVGLALLGTTVYGTTNTQYQLKGTREKQAAIFVRT